MNHDLRLIYVLGVLMVGAFALAGWSFYSGHKDSCQARNVSLNVLRDLLVDAQSQTPHDTTSRAFFKRQYARIDIARC